MLQLLVIIFIFLAAYGVSSQAILYPNEWRPMEILSNILYIPFYHMFGELYIAERNDWPFEDQLVPDDGGCFVGNREDIANNEFWNESDPNDVIRCPNKNVTVSFLQGLYMLSVNILLLNLMIAMFSTTFAKIENESEKYWKFGRYFLIQEYFYRSG